MRIREAQGTDVPEQREVPTVTGNHLQEAERGAQAAPPQAEAIIQRVPPAGGAVPVMDGGAEAQILIL